MTTARALVKQLSVLEIPDSPCIIVWRVADPSRISRALGEDVANEFVPLLHDKSLVVFIHAADDIALLTDEDLERIGLQRKNRG